MDERQQRLLTAYKGLYTLKCKSTDKMDNQCELSHLTMTQIEYLKVIDRFEYITISQLAKEVNNSKPTVTEMVKKFTSLDCVYKVKCNQDARKAYLKLTDRGLKIARMEENVLNDFIEIIISRLDEQEIDSLIILLEKIGSSKE